ncbi:hypothetical protein BD289DRAFT_484337 [Coniella lustricola]|uniref:SnoaL-like domain-containing protein n=1 Tax=Coniella lustricola TaxID=2025994 RepID=A0A2T3A2E3_9PEZI|nr:hypothetical protein BD289DRAFT_484337 [Coniella lustricola]
MRPPPNVAQAIAETKARYCRFADSDMWDALDKVVLPDFTFEVLDNGVAPSGIFPSFTSRETWVAYFRELFTTKQAMHLVGVPELEQVSPDEVRAVFPIQYVIADQGNSPDPESRITGGGHFHEVYRRVEDGWLLAGTKIAHTYCVLGQ